MDFELKREHFEVWGNGCTFILNADAFLALARGDIKLPSENELGDPLRYPLKVRRHHYCTHSELMWTQELAVSIRQMFYPEFGVRNLSALGMNTHSIVDPLVRSGVLVMVKNPEKFPTQDLYWSDDPWFVQNRAQLLKG